MGGVGSGTWWRFNKKDTENDFNSTTITFLTREGIVQPHIHRHGSLYWSRRGEVCSSINYETNTLDMSAPYFRVCYQNKKTNKRYDSKTVCTW